MGVTLPVQHDSANRLTGNQIGTTYRLPPELLGNCFAFLRIPDCIRASHVCQHWRAVALSTPCAWAQIETRCNDASDLERITLLLSRTGRVPADLKITVNTYTYQNAFDMAILPHAYHTRYLEWYWDLDGAALGDAPMLRYLVLYATLNIPDNFLDGRTGTLRSLHFSCRMLPAVCPSLSGLAALHINDVRDLEHAASWRSLFNLCPQLEFLSLADLQAEYADMLPSGPAPPSLRTLFLATYEELYDLTPHYTAWKTSSLRDVMLNMGTAHITYPIPQDFVGGATSLSVTLGPDPSFARWMVADFPDGRKRALGASGRDIYGAASHLAAVQPGLQQVHMLSISLDGVAPFLGVLAALPALKHLTLFVDWTTFYDELGRPELQEPTPGDLACLLDLADALPHLESLLLQMRLSFSGSESGCAIGRADLDDLLAAIDFIGPLSLPVIVIQGFSSEIVAGLDNEHLNRLRVRFDTGGMQQSDVRFDRSNAGRYWPFGYEP
ncbi:hypothetical protein AURDEDRAFT_170439 [Auricularia subglabra TFB-10046 SS5]|nr:hypothetical protein AURDEDRAFT_170439 [Auricularia subglabra TFB-10046 SS5]